MSSDDRVFVPLSALQKRLLGTRDVRLAAISARLAAEIPSTAAAITAALTRRHPGSRYEVRTELELLNTSGAIGSSETDRRAAIRMTKPPGPSGTPQPRA
jgi:hypothetical protein